MELYWSEPLTLDSGQRGRPEGDYPGAAGRRPAQGRDVLVAWYHSGFDGWLAGDFQIRTRRSGDGGASWGPIVVAATDGSETALYLGTPAGARPLYKRWWTTMFPDAAIDRIGRAHIVYVHDPEAGSDDRRGRRRPLPDQRPRTLRGAGQQPVTVNDDGPGRAQGFASLAARRHGRTTVVEAVWEDTRLAPDLPPGARQAQLYLYDIFHARLELGWDAGWSGKRPRHGCVVDAVSDLRRRAGFVAANDSGVIFAVWIDRRAAISPSDGADDVYGQPDRLP